MFDHHEIPSEEQVHEWITQVQAVKALPPDADKETIGAAQVAAEAALDNIVRTHQRFVYSVVRRYLGIGDTANTLDGESIDDLMQLGMIGLIKAAERYQPDQNAKYTTYARYWVKQEALRGVQNAGTTVRRPSHVHMLSSKVATFTARFWQQYQRRPQLHEISAALDVPVETLRHALRGALTISLDSPLRIGEDDGSTLGEMIADPNASAEPAPPADALNAKIAQMLDTLAPLERIVVVEHYLNGEKMKTIAKRLRTTINRAVAIRERALRKIRQRYQYRLA